MKTSVGKKSRVPKAKVVTVDSQKRNEDRALMKLLDWTAEVHG